MNKVPLPFLDLQHVMRNFGLIFATLQGLRGNTIWTNRITIKYMQYWAPLLVEVLVCLIFDNWKKKKKKKTDIYTIH